MDKFEKSVKKLSTVEAKRKIHVSGCVRTARLLVDLMVVQANKPPLNYAFIDQTENPQGFKEYIKAIHAGLEMNYGPRQAIFITLLGQSI